MFRGLVLVNMKSTLLEALVLSTLIAGEVFASVFGAVWAAAGFLIGTSEAVIPAAWAGAACAAIATGLLLRMTMREKADPGDPTL